MTDEAAADRASPVGRGFVPRVRREVAAVEIDGDAVVYNQERGECHLLNSTGALVWQLLDGNTRLDELSADLAEAFGAGFEDVLTDVVTLVEELFRLGLLEGLPGEPGDSSASATTYVPASEA
jgi:PqqD family protein of HPr-rel-A system